MFEQLVQKLIFTVLEMIVLLKGKKYIFCTIYPFTIVFPTIYIHIYYYFSSTKIFFNKVFFLVRF